jgi:hypothetical protein
MSERKLSNPELVDQLEQIFDVADVRKPRKEAKFVIACAKLIK